MREPRPPVSLLRVRQLPGPLCHQGPGTPETLSKLRSDILGVTTRGPLSPCPHAPLELSRRRAHPRGAGPPYQGRHAGGAHPPAPHRCHCGTWSGRTPRASPASAAAEQGWAPVPQHTPHPWVLLTHGRFGGTGESLPLQCLRDYSSVRESAASPCTSGVRECYREGQVRAGKTGSVEWQGFGGGCEWRWPVPCRRDICRLLRLQISGSRGPRGWKVLSEGLRSAEGDPHHGGLPARHARGPPRGPLARPAVLRGALVTVRCPRRDLRLPGLALHAEAQAPRRAAGCGDSSSTTLGSSREQRSGWPITGQGWPLPQRDADQRSPPPTSLPSGVCRPLKLHQVECTWLPEPGREAGQRP